jgi:hypothetical protein
LLVYSLVFGLPGGCSAPAPDEVDENVIVPPGKEDNFFSNVAREYMATADVSFTLDATWAQKTDAERLDRARKVMEGKTKQIAWFLHVYLIDKSHDDEAGDYGGLRAMVLDGSYESDALKPDPDDTLKFSYSFAVQVGGTRELLSKIRADQNLADDADTFTLKMAKLDNSQVVSFSHSGYKHGEWSPEDCGCDLEQLDVKLEPIEASNDAYLHYPDYYDDDVIDISIHVGWDYHARYDITHSRSLYNWLTGSLGFESPVDDYEKYNRLSGPLTKKLTVNGREITAKVTIFRPDPCESWDEDGSWGAWAKAVEEDEDNKKRKCDDWEWSDPKANANATTAEGAGNMMKDLKDSLKTRDAILFTGHSGYTYGYALASWYNTSLGDLDPPEIKTLDLPKDKSQLFVMSGCDTYHVAQAFKDNPNKSGLVNADVITTTSFSNAGDVGDTKDIVGALVGDASGKVSAVSYGRLMMQLNPSTYDWGYGHFTMYGIHGIDDNPLANPLGDPTRSCAPCTEDADCGAAGNVCVRLNATEKVCAVECLHDKGCPADQACHQFGSSSSNYVRGRACVPKSLSCGTPPAPPPAEKSFTASGTVERDQKEVYTVQVGPDATNIKATLTGDGDADLYTRFVEAPTKSDYDCRPYKGSSKETCEHAAAQGGVLHIMVMGYAAGSSSFELEVTWD